MRWLRVTILTLGAVDDSGAPANTNGAGCDAPVRCFTYPSAHLEPGSTNVNRLARAVALLVAGTFVACGGGMGGGTDGGSAVATGGGTGGATGGGAGSNASAFSLQTGDSCPAPLRTGISQGGACQVRLAPVSDGGDCAAVCCSCAGSSRQYSAWSCVDGSCADQATTCARALARSPDLCN